MRDYYFIFTREENIKIIENIVFGGQVKKVFYILVVDLWINSFYNN